MFFIVWWNTEDPHVNFVICKVLFKKLHVDPLYFSTWSKTKMLMLILLFMYFMMLKNKLSWQWNDYLNTWITGLHTEQLQILMLRSNYQEMKYQNFLTLIVADYICNVNIVNCETGWFSCDLITILKFRLIFWWCYTFCIHTAIGQKKLLLSFFLQCIIINITCTGLEEFIWVS